MPAVPATSVPHQYNSVLANSGATSNAQIVSTMGGGINAFKVKMWGAGGAGGRSANGGIGGAGGYVEFNYLITTAMPHSYFVGSGGIGADINDGSGGGGSWTGLIYGSLSTSRTACAFATASSLSATYSNGTSGVGATLTAIANGTLKVDGGNAGVSDRVLVKDQQDPSQNGVYTVTTAGTGNSKWVMTRATDFDASGTGEIENLAVFRITSGSVNGDTYWITQVPASVTVGTTAIEFTQAIALGIAAGGGGGGGGRGTAGGSGGGGGGTTGAAGTPGGGYGSTQVGNGGSQTAGGSPGTGDGYTGTAGGALYGGDPGATSTTGGGTNGASSYFSNIAGNGGKYSNAGSRGYGGGGGAGYYGGGGAGPGGDGNDYGGGGGGGGSSYIYSGVTTVSNTQGGTGSATAPNNTDTYYVSGVAIGGTAGDTSGSASPRKGGDGRLVILF